MKNITVFDLLIFATNFYIHYHYFKIIFYPVSEINASKEQLHEMKNMDTFSSVRLTQNCVDLNF